MAMGKKMGVQMRMVAAMSKNVPKMNSNTLIMRKMTQGWSLTNFIISPVFCGTSYKAMKYPNAAEMPMSNKTTPVVLHALAQAFRKLAQVKDR